MKKLSPLMEQYYGIKKSYKDKILFFRMGDFFEMFDQDAKIAAPILNIALTCRNKKADIETKMCGIPHHSISGPISKLLAQGLSVAICDQIEPAGNLGAIVKRAVTRVLSPGMVYDPDSLDQLSANYMSAFDKKHISFLDLSTGQAFYYEIHGQEDLFKLCEKFQPKEMVLSLSQKQACAKAPFSVFLSQASLNVFEKGIEDFALKKQSLNFKNFDSLPESAKRLIHYVFWTQGAQSLQILNAFQKQSLNQEMYCSHKLYTHLEIFKNSEGGLKETLFSAINRAKSPNGARLLKKSLQSPLIDKEKIEKRLDQIEWWAKRPQLIESTRKILSGIGDGERKLGKIAQPHCNARDLLSLKLWLECGLKMEDGIEDKNFSAQGKRARALRDKINHVISPSCPPSLKEGGLINKGVHPQLDEWMSKMKAEQSRLLQIEQRERNQLNIPSLKIRYNNVFGYYIEIRKTHSSKAPSSYMRKQTLVHAERYTTEELNGIEASILSARSQRTEIEYKIFKGLREEILKSLPFLTKLCKRWGDIDLFSSLAFLSLENKYVRPRFVSNNFCVKASRHPVLEQKNRHDFVPNSMDLPASQTLILTGPNMSGKSALMRQMALIVLLAQCGCFVPADSAKIPIFDKMFTRIGAGDMLSKGLSTFMVEMKETAEILEKADEKSFIVLDEIGRGTATFDGMSLAQAILEFLTVEKKPLLLSATHYQELTELARLHSSIQNASMAIKEENGEMDFLYLLKKGRANKSYGIQTARLAGLELKVLKRAEQLLAQRETAKTQSSLSHKAKLYSKEEGLLASKGGAVDCENPAPSLNHTEQKALLPKKQEAITALLKEITEHPLMSKTPLDAMNQIHKWQEKIRSLNELTEKTQAKPRLDGRHSQGKMTKNLQYKAKNPTQKTFLDILN